MTADELAGAPPPDPLEPLLLQAAKRASAENPTSTLTQPFILPTVIDSSPFVVADFPLPLMNSYSCCDWRPENYFSA